MSHAGRLRRTAAGFVGGERRADLPYRLAAVTGYFELTRTIIEPKV